MKLKAMALTGVSVAALALGAVPAAASTSGEGWTATPASTQQAAHRCVWTVGNTIQQGHGGWYRAKILHACKGLGVTPEIQCRDIRNHNFDKWGRTIYRKDATSKVACGTTLVIKEAWVKAGRVKQEVWPHHA